ncbi:hypothetical protein KI387_031520 [Taxus chinensis]|uniref:COBRA-like protein n=1 Tax=Taxus chinensis TaxID=29808 RepID=A0AA38CNQ5_TAXCH|nr:hypothetical protein KI387_031520 [Taxus chinensis]
MVDMDKWKCGLVLGLLFMLFLLLSPQTGDAYDPLDPNGNITIKWDIISWTADGYVAVVTLVNYQQYRHIQSPGWTLGWTWAKKEVIWSMVGAQATEQGDCSRFKSNIPHCCKKDPSIVDLLAGVPYNQQIANCCKGGVISSYGQDPARALAAFQLSVGSSGTTNTTVPITQELYSQVTRARVYLWACKESAAQPISQCRWPPPHTGCK